MIPTKFPNRTLSPIEQEIYADAKTAIQEYQIVPTDPEMPILFKASARDAFHAVAGKVVDAINVQMMHKTDLKIGFLAQDLKALGHAAYNDANQLGNTIKTCLFDIKAKENPFKPKY